MAAVLSVSVQATDCSRPYSEGILFASPIVLKPGTYRPVFSGTAAVGRSGIGGTAIAELQVRDAVSLGLLAQYSKSITGDVQQDNAFGYITLTTQSYVSIRSRAGAGCGSAAISGSVYFEKVG